MKLAIATEENKVSRHFGKCKVFTVYEIIEGQVKNRQLLDTGEHLQGELPSFLKSQGIDVIIAGSIGSGAQEKLNDLKLLFYTEIEGDTEEVVTDYIKGKFTSDKPMNCCGCCGCHQ